MSNLSDDVNIIDINIPGTHDSSTRYCQFSLFTCCQMKSISTQLSIGVRALDLRVNGKEMVHSLAKCKTASGKVLTIHRVVDNIYEFLEDNPTETVIMFFKNDGKISGEDCLEILVDDIISKNKDKWYLENVFPDLGTVRGKIILANRINSSVGLDFSRMPYQGGRRARDIDSFFVNENQKVILQDFCNVSATEKWEKGIKPLLNESERYSDSFVMNYLSTAGCPFVPEFNAKFINKKFRMYDLKRGNHYGVIFVDFINQFIVEKIINSNF